MSIYEEVDLEDMDYSSDTEIFSYPCPCGDKFFISIQELLDGEDVAPCPSCSLKIRVIYDETFLDKFANTNERTHELIKEGNDNYEAETEATEAPDLEIIE